MELFGLAFIIKIRRNYGTLCSGPYQHYKNLVNLYTAQPAITCSKLAIKTIEEGVKYVQR